MGSFAMGSTRDDLVGDHGIVPGFRHYSLGADETGVGMSNMARRPRAARAPRRVAGTAERSIPS